MNKKYKFKCSNCGGDTLVCISRVLMHEIVDEISVDYESDTIQFAVDVECDREYESVLGLYCEDCNEKWDTAEELPKELVNDE